MLSPENMTVEAIYAAPFFNTRSTGPADGMEKSYQEILRILNRLGCKTENFVFRGSESYLPSPENPVQSDAAYDLVEKALRTEETLYVVALGAPTNAASALLMEPEIIERIVIVWLGGNPFYWPSASEFNLKQDLAASKLLFDSGVPFIHIPCRNVSEHLRTTVPELERHIKGTSAIGDYLFQIFHDYSEDHFAWSKPLWDLAPVALLIDHSWVPTEVVHSPILTDQMTYSFDQNRHFIRVATRTSRDEIFHDLFMKIRDAH
jgi:inosine-uridine nucleoside N-ribohydrolase